MVSVTQASEISDCTTACWFIGLGTITSLKNVLIFSCTFNSVTESCSSHCSKELGSISAGFSLDISSMVHLNFSSVLGLVVEVKTDGLSKFCKNFQIFMFSAYLNTGRCNLSFKCASKGLKILLNLVGGVEKFGMNLKGLSEFKPKTCSYKIFCIFFGVVFSLDSISFVVNDFLLAHLISRTRIITDSSRVTSKWLTVNRSQKKGRVVSR